MNECHMALFLYFDQVPWIITRANNVYGRYQYPAQAVPKFVTCLLAGEKMPVHGTGKMSRKFIHVLDKCRAVKTLMERGTVGEIYNIGAPDEWTVLALCEKILAAVLGEKEKLADWTVYVADRRYNDCRYSVDSDKLERLGWRPEIAFEEGLRDTVAWYSSHRDHWSKATLWRGKNIFLISILPVEFNLSHFNWALIFFSF